MRTFTALPRAAALLAAAALALPVFAQSRPDVRPEFRHLDDVRAAIRKAEERPLSKLAAARTGPDTSGYDARKYTIRCDVDFSNHTIQAVTTVDAVATAAGLATVEFDFVGFTISSVAVDGTPVGFDRPNGGRTLRVSLPHALAEGVPFSVDVAYGGRPTIEDGLGFGFTADGAATFAEPEGARLWYPCKDRPSDKATYEGFVTVPSDLVVASNGRLVEVTQEGNRKTYHWLESHQIATYLIDFAISDYAVIEDSLGSLPVNHYVYPALEARARRDFSRTPEMIDALQTRLGVPYPFDKYGHALFENFGGAMEHQSCTSYGAGLITGDNRYDLVVAHELGHQWFGDLVSPAEWEEIWLNEGFATWTEFLWTENSDPSFVPALLANREQIYFSHEASVGAYSLYAPSHLFGTTVYQKGGWVVAMLRSLIGDEAFFAGLQAYLESHAYGNGTTGEFRAAMEAASGRDLTAFFDEWVYGTGYPVYDATWASRQLGAQYQVDVRIRQLQQTPTVFTYPLEVEVTGAGGARERQVVTVSSDNAIVSLCVGFQPSSVSLDPDNKVLGTTAIANGAVPAQPPACGVVPDEISVSAVAWKGGTLRVTGAGFVVGDAVVEVNGAALAKARYPKPFRNEDGTTTVVVGKQSGLKQLVPAGTAVQVTVLNRSTGLRSAPFSFTR
jgi:aminopeptidase N